MSAADVSLSPGGERVMRALAAAAIDPRELTWQEAAASVPTNPQQGMARIAYRLQRDGLVELSDWDGSRYGYVRLTELGREVARLRNFPASVRT